MAKNSEAHQITIDHEDIPGFMPAMTMPYEVKDATALNDVEVGDKIAAEVVFDPSGTEYKLEHLRVTDNSRRKTTGTVPARSLKIGDFAPNIPLINQDGKTIALNNFRGKAVLVNFIYTRCPLPEFCPRLSNQFSTIRENLAKTPSLYDKIHLISVTIDPLHDTSAVLRKYGLPYMDSDPSNFSHWDFCSTSAVNLRKLAEAFGLQYFNDKEQVIHSIAIVLIAPNGTIANYWGKDATTSQLETALRASGGGMDPQ